MKFTKLIFSLCAVLGLLLTAFHSPPVKANSFNLDVNSCYAQTDTGSNVFDGFGGTGQATVQNEQSVFTKPQNAQFDKSRRKYFTAKHKIVALPGYPALVDYPLLS